MPTVRRFPCLVIPCRGLFFLLAAVTIGCQKPDADVPVTSAPVNTEAPDSAAAPQPANGMDATKDTASQPDNGRDSWVAFKPPVGWYQVKFPEAPQLTEQQATVFGQPMMLHRAGVMHGNADAMMVLYSDYPMIPGLGSKPTDDGLVDHSVKSLVQALKGTDAKTEPLEREGAHGLKCTFKTPAGFGESHVMLVEGRMFQVSALRGAEGGFTESDVRSFLDSFTFSVLAEAPEWTVEELQRQWKNLPVGTLVRVSGRIASIRADMGMKSDQLNAALDLFTYGINSSNPFALLNPADANGLVPGQDVVLQGRAYPSEGVGGVGMTRIIRRGEVPPHSAAPFALPTADTYVALNASPLVTTQREGLSIEGWANMVTISSPDLLTTEGELIADVADGIRETSTLTGIHISGIPVKQSLIAQLAKMPQLRDVLISLGDADDFESLSIKDIDFTPLAGLSSLKSLSITQVPNVSDDHLKQISTFPCLQYLSVNTGTHADVTLSDEGFSSLSKLQSLVSLRIESWNGSEEVYYSDKFFEGFRNHPNLSALLLSSDGLDGSCFATLATCPRLSALELTSFELSSDSFNAFTRDSWTGLREISLGGFEDESSAADVLKVIDALPNQIQSITFSGSAINGETIDAIVARNFSELSSLSIPEADIKDTDVENLAAIKSLSSVFLPAQISEAAREKLKASLPEGAEIL